MNNREALSQALKSFGVTSYVIYGDVTDEETYNQYVRETIGINEETNESILSDGPSISWEIIEPKYQEEFNKIPNKIQNWIWGINVKGGIDSDCR